MKPTNLKKKSEQLGIRQIEISTALGVSESFINRILNGWRRPSDAMARKIEAYIEKRREQLIKESQPRSDKQV